MKENQVLIRLCWLWSSRLRQLSYWICARAAAENCASGLVPNTTACCSRRAMRAMPAHRYRAVSQLF